jgi:manganese-transporting P-type ATPase
VFARTSPNQKDFITRTLNEMGHVTAMCGDGTNDVGSLKSATVGIAVLNQKTPKQLREAERKARKDKGEQEVVQEVLLSKTYTPQPGEGIVSTIQNTQIHLKKYMEQ